MKISTARFGSLEVEDQDILFFSQGILGFEDLSRFFIIDPKDEALIMWLQSVDDGKVAFPIIEPQVLDANYSVKFLSSDLEVLGLKDSGDIEVYVILTIPKDIKKVSANFKAPLIVNPKRNLGGQIVLQDNRWSVCREVYRELKTHIVTGANTAFTRRGDSPLEPLSNEKVKEPQSSKNQKSPYIEL